MTQVSTIEFSLVEVSVMHGLKQGNEVLEEIHKEMNVESVEKLLDETREAQAYQRVRVKVFAMQLPLNLTTCILQEIDEMLSNNLTLDEEESVQQELRELEEEAVKLFLRDPCRSELMTSQLLEERQKASAQFPKVPLMEPTADQGRLCRYCHFPLLYSCIIAQNLGRRRWTSLRGSARLSRHSTHYSLPSSYRSTAMCGLPVIKVTEPYFALFLQILLGRREWSF